MEYVTSFREPSFACLKPSSDNRSGMKNLICAVSLLSLLNCTTKEKSTRHESPDSVQAASTTTPTRSSNTVSAKTPSQPSVAAGKTTWTYEKKVDQEGSTAYKASVTSPNLLQFNFPYAGGSTATLTIRHKNGTSYLYLEVSRGQFNRSFQGGTARIRFDDKPSQNYSFSAAENGRANIIFFDSEKKLINQMKTARKMIVDIDFYAQGRRQIEFRTAGLTWNH
jgi:hypothetical protein